MKNLNVSINGKYYANPTSGELESLVLDVATQESYESEIDEILDSTYGKIDVAGIPLWTSDILKSTDPTAYHELKWELIGDITNEVLEWFSQIPTDEHEYVDSYCNYGLDIVAITEHFDDESLHKYLSALQGYQLDSECVISITEDGNVWNYTLHKDCMYTFTLNSLYCADSIKAKNGYVTIDEIPEDEWDWYDTEFNAAIERVVEYVQSLWIREHLRWYGECRNLTEQLIQECWKLDV